MVVNRTDKVIEGKHTLKVIGEKTWCVVSNWFQMKCTHAILWACVFNLCVKSVFGFHCLHDCLCISTTAEPCVFHFRTDTIHLRSFFITSLISAPRGKWPPMLHEPRGNTTPFGPKLSKYGPQPTWSCLSNDLKASTSNCSSCS